MTWLDKVKERWERDELEGTGNNNVLFERFVQAREDRAKLLRLAEYAQHKTPCKRGTPVGLMDDAEYDIALRHAPDCSCGLTALLESDDAQQTIAGEEGHEGGDCEVADAEGYGDSAGAPRNSAAYLGGVSRSICSPSCR